MTQFHDRAGLTRAAFAVDDNGYLTVPARISRAGIQIYHGSELIGVEDADPDATYRIYRPDSEVFDADAMASFANLPVTDGHPPVGVSAENYTDTAIGHALGKVTRDGNFLRATLTIRDFATVEKIMAGEGVQISTGYHADVTLAPGITPEGKAYDGIQSHIRGNHIALVDAARCGPECRLGDLRVTDCDCASCQSNKGQTMSERNKRLTDEGDPNIAQTVAELKAANARLSEALETAQETIKRLTAELEAKSGEVEAMSATSTQDAAFEARVTERTELILQARNVLGDQDFTQRLNADIRRAAIAHIYGDKFVEGASDHALIGMFKVLARDTARFTDNLNGSVRPASTQLTLSAARNNYKQRLANAWKEAQA